MKIEKTIILVVSIGGMLCSTMHAAVQYITFTLNPAASLVESRFSYATPVS